MGTIADKLTRIITTKEDIRQALISKGYDVPTSIPFKEYAKMILDLPCKADSFPDIEGIVARYSASGLTNEQMAKNPVWVDKTGNGHDIQLKNLSWAGMSGVGGYKYNFLSNDWSADVDQSSVVLSHEIVIINKRTSVQLIKFIRNELENTINITLKITGLEANGSHFKIYDNVGSSHAQRYNKDGIYQINYTATEGANKIYFYVPGGNMGQLENPITIEQLPLYPGALVFDGVDDYGTCNNFPILTKEKGYTVVALRQWIEEKNSITALVSNSKNWNQDGAFVFEYNNLENNYPNLEISFGSNTELGREKSSFTYQTSKLYNGKEIKFGEFLGSDRLTVAKSNENLSPNSNVAIWELVILDHDATEEELTKIKDYFVKTYPWLFPDQAWTVTGKTNEDEDRATIANITGNGNDLVLSNFGFAKGSGYGLYGFKFFSKAGIEYYSGSKISFSKHQLDQITLNPYILVYPGTSYPREKDITAKIKVAGLKEGVSLTWGWAGNTELTITEDGTYSISAGSGKLRELDVVYAEGFDPDHVVTIEQIPEYEGYLVTDGVDDKITSSAFEMGKDFTVVGEWRFIIDERKVAGLIKPPSFYLFNENNGLKLFINNTEKSSSLNTKSLKAICSDGRVYFDDWSEMLLSEEQPITSSSKDLSIGYNSTIYTQMAFKNLGIYNDQLLSKDDCIKAYNYLQTLKAK